MRFIIAALIAVVVMVEAKVLPQAMEQYQNQGEQIGTTLLTPKQKNAEKQFKKVFTAMDANKDGRVTWTEYWTWVEKYLKRRDYLTKTIQAYKGRIQNTFKMLAGADNVLTWPELQAYIKKQYK